MLRADRPTLTLFRDGFPDPPPLDTAVSSVLLHRVSDGSMPDLLRLHRPGAIVARGGEGPGEYCPGEHSVNARGQVKVMGVGQRLVATAAHVGGVIVVSGAERIRQVLVPVYEALGLTWDPSTVGALADEVPG